MIPYPGDPRGKHIPINNQSLVLAALLGVASVGQAGLLVQEGFQYPAGALDGTQVGGIGFADGSSWGVSGGSIVAGLTYPGLVTAGSGAFHSDAGATSARPLAAAFGGSTFYLSMLINANTTETERLGFELQTPGPAPCSAGCRAAGGCYRDPTESWASSTRPAAGCRGPEFRSRLTPPPT